LEHIQPAEPARIADSDLLCLSTLNAGADKTFRFARDVRQRLGIPIVIGGTQATYFPEACLEHCDYVVLGEGDETIVELVDALARDLKDKRRYGRHVMFVDNEFAAQRTYTKRLLRRLIDERLDFDFGVFARVEIAKDDELLDLMRRAGISYVYQGYESVQPETLMAYDKRQTLEQMVFAIEKLQRYGFDILGSFVLGADTDTLETIRRTVAFII